MKPRSAWVLALVVVAVTGCADRQEPVADSSTPIGKKSGSAADGPEPEEPSGLSADSLFQPFSTVDEEPSDLPVPPLFEGYSIVEKGQPRIVAEGKYTVMFPIDEERSPHLEGVRDLDYIRDNLKMIAEYDSEHHYVYCRIANTGQKDIVFNEYWVGYFAVVTLKCKDRLIPRDSDKDALRFLQGIGPHLHANITLPGRAMYESREGQSCWLRFGPPKTSPSDPKVRILKLITPRPRKGKGVSFRDDLLDFDWEQIDGNRVEVVVCQRLANVRPTEPDGSFESFQIESNPIEVDANALKTYKRRLRRFRDKLLQQAETRESTSSNSHQRQSPAPPD
jgi:hypothetical protein